MRSALYDTSRAGKDPLPLFLIPGMSPEFSIYSRLLPLLPKATVVDFLKPAASESLKCYAARMAEGIPSQCFLVGVSFGGMLAMEISRIVRPAGCVVISSVLTPSELPPWLRAWRIAGGRGCGNVLRAVGASAAIVPGAIRTRSTIRLTKLSGNAGAWHRWATAAVLGWKADLEPFPSPLLRIHGDRDTTFPIRYTRPGVVINGAPHDLPYFHPRQTAEAIIEFMKRCQGNALSQSHGE